MSFGSSTTIIDVIYYYVVWTDNGSMLPEANTRRQEGKYPTIKVRQSCFFKLLLHLVNSVPILYRTGNIQSAILLSVVASFSLPADALLYQSMRSILRLQYPALRIRFEPKGYFTILICNTLWQYVEIYKKSRKIDSKNCEKIWSRY